MQFARMSSSKVTILKGPIRPWKNEIKTFRLQLHVKPGAKQSRITDMSLDSIGVQVQGSFKVGRTSFIDFCTA